jgi:hypothetical protein
MASKSCVRSALVGISAESLTVQSFRGTHGKRLDSLARKGLNGRTATMGHTIMA